MSLVKLLTFNTLGDERGQLFSVEGNKNIPFGIKRMYYMFDMHKNVPRGFHAHKSLQQVAICVHGQCKILLDDGESKEEVILNKAKTGLIIDKLIWHEMHDFEDDCILMVIASDYYDENDYLRNYDEFLSFVGKQ